MAVRDRALAMGGALSLALCAACGCGSSDATGGNGDGSTGGGTNPSGVPAAGSGASGGIVNGAGGAMGGAGAERVPVKPSLGCSETSPSSGAFSLLVDEVERTYLVSLPENYEPSRPYPLVFAFHGLGGSGELVSGPWYFGIEQQGGTPSIFVYPDGLETGDGAGWPNQEGRDVAFFDALLATMQEGYCIDENRVFSTGHSYGGIMTLTLACERASVLRGVAPVAGAHFASGSCSGPVAAWGAHGNPDPTVSYESGLDAMARLLETNGCDESSAVAVEPLGACIEYACDAGYPVTWCEHDQGHDFPDFAAASIKAFFDGF